MTNHPRSPRAKFKVGQVVVHLEDWCDHIGKLHIVNHVAAGEFLLSVNGHKLTYARNFRPLTKKEAGR